VSSNIIGMSWLFYPIRGDVSERHISSARGSVHC
jgi:hypothetical protein